MIRFTVFDPTDGRILRVGGCPPDSIDLQAEDGEAVIALDSEASQHWIDPETLERKDKQPITAHWTKEEIAADGVDQAILLGLPIGVTTTVDGVGYYINDASLRLTVNDPGTYRVVVDDPKYFYSFWDIEAI